MGPLDAGNTRARSAHLSLSREQQEDAVPDSAAHHKHPVVEMAALCLLQVDASKERVARLAWQRGTSLPTCAAWDCGMRDKTQKG